MTRVVGIGGIFFKARDADRLRAWYRAHLGLEITDWGGVVFEPMTASPAGRQVDDRVKSSEFGRFGWVVDPEDNRLELWEPPRVP